MTKKKEIIIAGRKTMALLDGVGMERVCLWIDAGEYFSTGCAKAFCFNNPEGVKNNGFKYCPYCSDKIKVVK